jgi:putative ABC transport system permease protein
MRNLRKLFFRCLGFFTKKRDAARLQQEVAHYLEMATEDYIKSGHTPEQARRQASLDFGSLESIKEDWRDQSTIPWLENLWRDIRHGSRSLWKAPAFSAFTVLGYAIGIGAATLTFTVFDHVLLRPFSFEQPDRLLSLYGHSARHASMHMLSLPDFREISALADTFSSSGAMLPAQFDTTGGPYPERFLGRIATRDFLPTLGIQPILGRPFSKGDYNAILLSHATWVSRFGSDPNALGQKLSLRWNNQDAKSYTVIGVLPSSIDAAFPRHAELWVQLDETLPEVSSRSMGAFEVVVRMRDGISIHRAKAALASYSKVNPDLDSIFAAPLHEQLTKAPAELFPAIMAAVAFLLALACTNIASLTLVRGHARLRELKVRTSLGASRSHLIRQLLTESTLLALVGGCLGTALAASLLQVARALIPVGFLRADLITIDSRILLTAAAFTLLTGIVTGLWPALRLSTLTFTGRSRSTHFLVVAEVAISLVLLSAASLTLHSLYRILSVNIGFNASHLIAMQTSLPRPHYADPNRRAQAIQQILHAVNTTPGLSSAAVSDFRPLGNTMNVAMQSQSAPVQKATTESIAGKYFQTLGIPLLAGRDFDQRDSPTSPKVAILSRSAAELLWPSGQALGKEFQTVGHNAAKYLVVGIADEVRRHGPLREAKPHFYTSTNQQPPYLVEIIVRTRPGVEAASLLQPIRKSAASVNSALGIHEAVVLEESIRELLNRPRWIAALLGSFGLLALLLTALGIYGSTSNWVGQRRFEIGVRMAVGATQSQIRNHFLGRGLAYALFGMGIGALGIYSLSRFLAGMLYGLKPLDPISNLTAALLLLLVALAANYFPARQAARMDPSSALRAEATSD